METTQQPIVVLCSMDCEYELLAAAVQGATETAEGNFRFTAGTFDGYPIVVIRCLIGSVNAAAATVLALERYHPACVILQGTAGGHNPDLRQHDIVLGQNIVEYISYFVPHRDRGAGIALENWQFVGAQMVENGKLCRVAAFHSDETLLQIAAETPYAAGNMHIGTIVSADMWNREIDRIEYLHEKTGSDCEEMEGAAVAQVCAQFSVPMLDIRIISNSELHPDRTFSEVSPRICQEFCMAFLKNLIDKQAK